MLGDGARDHGAEGGEGFVGVMARPDRSGRGDTHDGLDFGRVGERQPAVLMGDERGDFDGGEVGGETGGQAAIVAEAVGPDGVSSLPKRGDRGAAPDEDRIDETGAQMPVMALGHAVHGDGFGAGFERGALD